LPPIAHLDSFAVKDMIITHLTAEVSGETKGHPLIIGRMPFFAQKQKTNPL
jgi:hypothetical protein